MKKPVYGLESWEIRLICRIRALRKRQKRGTIGLAWVPAGIVLRHKRLEILQKEDESPESGDPIAS